MSDPKVVVRQQYTTYVLQKLGSYFKEPKDKIRTEYTELDVPNVIYSRILNDKVGFNKSIYVTHVDKLVLDNFIKYKSFIKSKIYSEFLNGKGIAEGATDGDYVLALHFNGLMFVIYLAELYDGYGGVYVKEEGADNGYVIEPLEHYLKYYWPKDEED